METLVCGLFGFEFMKKHLGILTALLVSVALSSQAQRGGGMGGPPSPEFGGAMAKYFGDNSNFSANMEMQTKGPDGSDLMVPGQLAYAEGKSRFEVDMTKMKGGQMPPEAAEQMKAMGMGSVMIISRPDKKISDIVYPG